MTTALILLIIALILFLIFKHKKKPKSIAVRRLHNKNNTDWLVLDTETTGISKASEIIEIAVSSAEGELIYHSYVLPKGRIPSEATAIHGITRKKIKDAPIWPEVQAQLSKVLEGRLVYCYNAEFDMRLMKQSAKKWGIEPLNIQAECAMLVYAELRGEKHPYRPGEYKWHKLTKACRYEGLAIDNAHSALGDARMTANLLRYSIAKYC